MNIHSQLGSTAGFNRAKMIQRLGTFSQRAITRAVFRREDADMKKYLLKLTSLISILLAMASFLPSRAVADDDDPPGRVARLSYAHGAISFQPAGTDDWVSAVVNRP